MKGKIIGILIATLLISAALPAVGTMNIVNKKVESSAQIPGVEWTQKYGEDEYDVFYDVDVTTDGGYIVCGNHEENGNYYPYVLKVDSGGNQEWNWTIREFEYNDTTCYVYDNWASAIMQTSDGGYILCVYILFEFEEIDILVGGLVKFDESGNFLWFSHIAEPWVWWFVPSEVIEPEGEGIYVTVGTGAYNGDPTGDTIPILAVTDLSGTMINYEFYEYGNYDDEGYALCKAGDGYLISGTAFNTPSNYDYRMIKTDSDLQIIYDNTYSRTGNDGSYNSDCFQTSDGGFIMAGQSYEPGFNANAWAVRTDSDLNMVWNKSYGDIYTDTCWSMAETSDVDEYVLCVTMNFNGYTGDKEDTHLVKLDDDGKIKWVQINGGPEREVGIAIKETEDGGFIVAGRDGTSYSKDADAVLTKFAPFDNERPDKPDKPAGKTRINIGEEYTYKSSTSDFDGDNLYYQWDWGDGNFSEWLGPYESGETCEASHIWNETGPFEIKVMAKDINCGESDWSESLIVKPRTRVRSSIFPLRLFEQFPNAQLLIKYIFGLL